MRHPPEEAPPLAQSMLGDTVNARAVRILLECILVLEIIIDESECRPQMQSIGSALLTCAHKTGKY